MDEELGTEGTTKIKISLPNVDIDVSSEDSIDSLREVRKILELTSGKESLPNDLSEFEESLPFYNEALFLELKHNLSPEFFSNSKIVESLKDALHRSEEYVFSQVKLNLVEEFDLINKNRTKKIILKDLKSAINELFSNVEQRKELVEHSLVHILGDINDEQTNMISERIKRRLDQSPEVFYSLTDCSELPSKKEFVLLETVFFGDF